ncbi:hemicentin-2 isoform X6 [Drosophila sechellia]|uniref:hemicentin-2 isoform X6 n=1 Tax=Drosophila sechellia TaxID=7238 RepID=UPI0013DDBEDB|nr:hemicentin-2 isoform X6 [Drosophila sechellia]
MGNMALRRSAQGVAKSNSVAVRSPISLSLVLLLCLALVDSSTAQVDTTISQQESQSVVLPCPVDAEKCGKLHSLNWFKGDDRIAAMLLGDSNVTSVNKEFDERVTVEQNPYRLVIKDLKIADEDIYLCDTTFFIPEETCDNFNGYRIELRVLVPPTEVVILDAKGDRIENGSVVGPMQERQSLKATCTVRNTRPQPEVSWFRGTKRLTTYSPTHDLVDGLYTSTLELDWTLSREDLAQDIECRVKSAAIPNVAVTKFSVDLQVRPTSIDINGVKHHTVQGSKVVLTCDIHGARPAVNLTWYNTTTVISSGENEISEVRTKSLEKSDGTFHTQSELIFNATRFENDRVFRCEAENIVLQINREKPISSALTLEVLYPPVVKVSPSAITANTSEIVLLNCEYFANPASLTQVEWYRNDILVNVNDTTHFKGGNSENVALVIKSTEKEDIGNYSCQLSNNIGTGTSDHKINLDVQYAPSVEILMIPEGPVKESDESNVTLFCNVLDANPSVLTKVRWYANSTLLKELPDCEETREDLCHIDPSKLLLESIGRGFFYNYSCEGFNAAGWGPRSEDKELLVHYEPGPAALSHFPLVAVKKKSVTFSCSVDDPGFPESNRFVAQKANQNHKTKTPQHAPLMDFHTVQAMQPQEADIAFEAMLLHKHQNPLPFNDSTQTSIRTPQESASHPAHQIKETHALIDLHLNHSLCTLITLTTYTPQSQILTLYTGVQQKKDASATSYALYRKMGKFSFVAQIVSKPNRFRWLRGGRGPLQDIVTKDWTVEPVGLDSRTNYSCYAYNEGGKGVMATVNLEVHAPPFFIKNLPPYTGILHSSPNATLTCRIECVPRCDISWQKDGVPIERNDTRYFIKEKYMDASPATGDFESMLSVLHFNMPNWPDSKFNIEADNANYSCVSTGNIVGGSIRSRTYFGIEYAPENTTVSENIVYVQEGTIPGRVICKSRANPEPSYKWIFKNETIANGNALIINTAMNRNDDGTYTCFAYNKHGSSIAKTVIKVQFKPRCEIERQEIDDQDTLICTAYGNPIEADFSWSIKTENETDENLGSGKKENSVERSFYILETDYAISRTYRCVANNTVGYGPFCEIEVAVRPKKQLAWWQLWEKNTLIILVAAILGLLLTVIVICCIIICICRRRRRQDKLHDKSSSLGEPLTEPGEYENLPFHGLQTAPNKFSTTPTSFNNNTNAVRVAQRPKEPTGNINQPSAGLYQDCQATHDPLLYHQKYFCDQDALNDQRSQYTTMHRPPNNVQYNQCLVKPDSNPQDQHNLSNSFSKSYTEYYQQHKRSEKVQMLFPPGASKELNSNSLCNTDHTPHSALVNIKPYLEASNFREYDRTGEELLGSMPRARHSKGTLNLENKFYSLKHLGGIELINRDLEKDYSIGVTTSSTPSATENRSLSKCKIHNSFGCNRLCNAGTNVQPMRLYDPPGYQNMVVEHADDQITVSKKDEGNLATVQTHTHAGKDKMKNHHHWIHQHRERKDEGLGPDVHQVEPERISIHRSDSGISNSSYESQFSKPKMATLNTSSGPLVRKYAHRNIKAHNSVFNASYASNVTESEAQLDNSSTLHQSCTVPSVAPSHCNRPKPRNRYSKETTKNECEQHQRGHQSLRPASTPSECISLDTSSRSECIMSTVPAQCGIVDTPNELKIGTMNHTPVTKLTRNSGGKPLTTHTNISKATHMQDLATFVKSPEKPRATAQKHLKLTILAPNLTRVLHKQQRQSIRRSRTPQKSAAKKTGLAPTENVMKEC